MTNQISRKFIPLVLAFIIGLTFTLATATFGEAIPPEGPSVAVRYLSAVTVPESDTGAQFFDPYSKAAVDKVVAARKAEMLKDASVKSVDSEALSRAIRMLNKVKVDKLDVHASDGAIIKTIVGIDANVVLNKIQNKKVTEAVNPVSAESMVANKRQRDFVREYWHSRDAIYAAAANTSKTRAQVASLLVAHFQKYKTILIKNSGLQYGDIKLYYNNVLTDGEKVLIAEDMIKIISFVMQVEKMDKKVYGTTSARNSILALIAKAKTNVESQNPGLLTEAPKAIVMPTPLPPTPNPNIKKTTSYSNGYKFDPPITVTTIRYLSPATTFLNGEDIDYNVWTKAYQSYCGIKLKSLFTVTDFSYYDLKVTTAIATDSLPDIIPVYTTLFYRIADSGRSKDILPYYSRYLDPELKALMSTEDGGIALNTCFRDGKLAALAAPATKYPNMMWIRQDWLDKYKLKWPKTINEAVSTMKTFSKKNAGAPYASHTYAFPLTASIESGFPNAYGAYRNIWISDGAGGLMRSDVSTKWKTVLAKMSDLYNDGYIDPDFTLKNSTDIASQMVNQQYGFYFESSSAPDSMLYNSVMLNPKAVWKQGIIPNESGSIAKVQVESRVTTFTCVNKNSKYPEALMFLANIYGDLANGKGTAFAKYHTVKGADGSQYDTYMYPVVALAYPQTDTSSKIAKALKTGVLSNLNGQQIDAVGDINRWLKKKDSTGWGAWAMFKSLGSESTKREILVNKFTYADKGWGPETPSWINYGPDLYSMNAECFVKIVRGDMAVSDGFDKWVDYFINNGGKEATNEINEWWKAEGKALAG